MVILGTFYNDLSSKYDKQGNIDVVIGTFNLMNILKTANRFAKWESPSIHVAGMTLLGVSLMLIPCLLFAISNGEDLGPYLWPMSLGIIISIFTIFLFKMPRYIRPINGLIMIGVVWITCILFGILPFVLSGMPLIDAIFESTSGFTTTGATIMANIESWPSGILLWRSVTNAIGGIITVIIFLLIFPIVGYGERTMFSNELSGSDNNGYTVKVKDAAKQFILIYSALVVIMLVLLMIAGVSLYESLCMSMSAVSTGGFMCKNDSLASYDLIVKAIATLFMFLGGTNFYLHYRSIIEKKPASYLKNEEFVVMAGWFTFVSVIVFLILYGGNLVYDAGTIVTDFINVALNVVSAGTNTGFASSDFALWPGVALLFILIITLIGGSSGSTSGGIKISRVIIIFRTVKNGFLKMIHPSGVFDVKYDKKSINDQGVISAFSIALLFLVTVLIGSIIIMLCGISVDDSFALVISCITNFGPGIGNFGPMGSCQDLIPFAKIVLSVVMWIGRLEIVAALILFTPKFWKEIGLFRGRTKKTG